MRNQTKLDAEMERKNSHYYLTSKRGITLQKKISFMSQILPTGDEEVLGFSSERKLNTI